MTTQPANMTSPLTAATTVPGKGTHMADNKTHRNDYTPDAVRARMSQRLRDWEAANPEPGAMVAPTAELPNGKGRPVIAIRGEPRHRFECMSDAHIITGVSRAATSAGVGKAIRMGVEYKGFMWSFEQPAKGAKQ